MLKFRFGNETIEYRREKHQASSLQYLMGEGKKLFFFLKERGGVGDGRNFKLG